MCRSEVAMGLNAAKPKVPVSKPGSKLDAKDDLKSLLLGPVVI
jgi:hypothetical protein